MGVTETLGSRLGTLPKVVSKGDSSVLSPGAALIASCTVGRYLVYLVPRGPV